MSLPVSAPVAFEKLQININTVDITKVQELSSDAGTAETSVFHKMSVVETPDNKELVVDISIVFRNKHTRDREALLLKGFFTVNAGEGEGTSDTFYALLRYIFLYTKDYIAENDIRDKDGNLFIIPDCHFSTSQSGQLIM